MKKIQQNFEYYYVFLFASHIFYFHREKSLVYSNAKFLHLTTGRYIYKPLINLLKSNRLTQSIFGNALRFIVVKLKVIISTCKIK